MIQPWDKWFPAATAPLDGSEVFVRDTAGHVWLSKWNGVDWEGREPTDPVVSWAKRIRQ